MNLFGSSSEIVVIPLPPAPSLLGEGVRMLPAAVVGFFFFFVVGEHKVRPYGETDFFSVLVGENHSAIG